MILWIFTLLYAEYSDNIKGIFLFMIDYCLLYIPGWFGNDDLREKSRVNL